MQIVHVGSSWFSLCKSLGNHRVIYDAISGACFVDICEIMQGIFRMRLFLVNIVWKPCCKTEWTAIFSLSSSLSWYPLKERIYLGSCVFGEGWIRFEVLCVKNICFTHRTWKRMILYRMDYIWPIPGFSKGLIWKYLQLAIPANVVLALSRLVFVWLDQLTKNC